MAKTRVSHLAKEFNLDVKELILRLREINIEVDNYLSSIEATEVARAREMLAKAVPLVEEQRVASHVKRRRALARPKQVTERNLAPHPAPDDQPATGELQEARLLHLTAPRWKLPPVTGNPGMPMVSQKRRKIGDKPAKIIALPETPKPEPGH